MCSLGQSEPRKNGYVPDEATAVRIAEAVFIPIYGEKRLHAEQPFHAVLKSDYWVVSGTLPKPRNPNEVIVGGTMTAEINRLTGCIRSVYHSR
jgi:hypothetical protein